MGSSSSHVVQCKQIENVGQDELSLQIDKEAFSFHFLKKTPIIRVTKLGINGQWSTDSTFGSKEAYEDSFVRIQSKNSTKDPAEVSLEIKKDLVYLYQKPGTRATNVLCEKGEDSYIYITILLKKIFMKPSKIVVTDDTILLCKDYILIINTPDDEKFTRPNISDILTEGNTLLFLASKPPAP